MLKLQLDLKTLESLIGQDTPFQLEIREGIIQTFAQRHLKALVNTKAMQSIQQEINKDTKAIQKLCQKEISELLPVKLADGYQAGRYQRFEVDKTHSLYDSFRKHLVEEGKRIGREVIQEAISELKPALLKYVESCKISLQNQIKDEVAQRITIHFQAMVDAEIKRRLKALAATTE